MNETDFVIEDCVEKRLPSAMWGYWVLLAPDCVVIHRYDFWGEGLSDQMWACVLSQAEGLRVHGFTDIVGAVGCAASHLAVIEGRLLTAGDWSRLMIEPRWCTETVTFYRLSDLLT